jgi:sugar lactone lactonase YvrE
MELVFYAGSSLLEGPIWDAENKLIYCVSIEQNLIYQININTGNIKSFPTNGNVGCIVLKDNYILSAEKTGIYKINIQSKYREQLIQSEFDSSIRYNDGKLDPIGRFLVGTKSDKENEFGKGKLFSYYLGEYKELLNNLTISNGIGFSNDGGKMYFIDTPTKKVAQYKYNTNTGDLIFDKYIVNIDGPGLPDGMCVDLDGNIWVAEWEGGRVRKWDVNMGTVLDEITLPCSRVTSCCLGGDDYKDLYITTAKDDKNTLGGALFKIKLK